MDNNIFIISTIKLFNGNSAGSSRVMNYARAISRYKKVYLFSLRYGGGGLLCMPTKINIDKNIYEIIYKKDNGNKITKKFFKPIIFFLFLTNVLKFAKIKKLEPVFLLYPSTETLFDYFVIIFLKKIKKKKVFLELNEIRKFSSVFEKNNLIKKNLFDKFILKILYIKYVFNEKLIKYYDGVIGISTNILKYYKNEINNYIYIPILTNRKIYFNNNFNYYSKNKKFKIAFAGSINLIKENLELFFEILFLLNKKGYSISLDMFGFINKKDKIFIENLIYNKKLNNIINYKGIINQDNLNNILKNYHLLVLPRGNIKQNKYGFSTKLAEYLISNVPILVTNVSDNSIYIKDNINGFIIEPDNKYEFINKLEYIINNYNILLPKILTNAVKTANKYFYYDNYSKKLVDFLC